MSLTLEQAPPSKDEILARQCFPSCIVGMNFVVGVFAAASAAALVAASEPTPVSWKGR